MHLLASDAISDYSMHGYGSLKMSSVKKKTLLRKIFSPVTAAG
jgi:hypothetical protein